VGFEKRKKRAGPRPKWAWGQYRGPVIRKGNVGWLKKECIGKEEKKMGKGQDF